MKGTGFSKTAARIAQRFALASGPLLIEPLGRGLINESFKVTAGTDRWVLQRINGQVFADPEGIMANLSRLAAHLARQEGLDLTWPALAQTAEGATWARDEEGAVWRLMTFIPGQPLERIEGASQAAEVGRLLGAFHRAVADAGAGRVRDASRVKYHPRDPRIAQEFEGSAVDSAGSRPRAGNRPGQG